jgi:hypothetical protein
LAKRFGASIESFPDSRFSQPSYNFEIKDYNSQKKIVARMRKASLSLENTVKSVNHGASSTNIPTDTG